MKLPKNLRGKYVTRAAFAKMQAEKQRLEADIKLMCSGSAEGGVVWQKWRKHFKTNEEFTFMLRGMLTKHFDRNPVVGGCGKHPGQNFINCPICQTEKLSKLNPKI